MIHIVNQYCYRRIALLALASIRISNGSPLVYEDYYTKLHIVAMLALNVWLTHTRRVINYQYNEWVWNYHVNGHARPYLSITILTTSCAFDAKSLLTLWPEGKIYLSDPAVIRPDAFSRTRTVFTVALNTFVISDIYSLCARLVISSNPKYRYIQYHMHATYILNDQVSR